MGLKTEVGKQMRANCWLNASTHICIRKNRAIPVDNEGMQVGHSSSQHQLSLHSASPALICVFVKVQFDAVEKTDSIAATDNPVAAAASKVLVTLKQTSARKLNTWSNGVSNTITRTNAGCCRSEQGVL